MSSWRRSSSIGAVGFSSSGGISTRRAISVFPLWRSRNPALIASFVECFGDRIDTALGLFRLLDRPTIR